MPRYIDANKIILKTFYFPGADGEIYIDVEDVKKAIAQTPTADVAPKSEVARDIFEQIHREIAEAIKSNVRAIDERQEKYNIYEDDFIHRCYGKIDALRGIDAFITELKEKCAKEDPNADT